MIGNSAEIKSHKMKLQEGRVTLLVGSERTTIEFIDSISNITFAKAVLTASQLSQVLSRTAYVECDISVHGLDRIGKKMIHKQHEFEIPGGIRFGNENTKEILSEIIKETLPDGWVSDNYFSSQNTFFSRGGKEYAQTTIRKWVDPLTNL